MTAGFITVQNPDPVGLILLLVGLAILRIAVWAMEKHDNAPREPVKRCQVCGAQIDYEAGEWTHVDPNALLVIRAMPHIPEPLTAVPR